VIVTVLATILMEGCVVFIYCAWRKKPVGKLIGASLLINVLTQIALWAVLRVFFQQYLLALFISEVLIWLVESLLLFYLVKEQLKLFEAVILSLMMNVVSFGVGWFLPV
jgi:hypothetical protein